MLDHDRALRLQARLGVRQDGVAGPETLGCFFAAVVSRHPGPDILATAKAAAACFPDAGIVTPLRLAHWTAQAAAETNFRTFVEMWGPTDAQRRYEGRADLGNVKPGDGYRYRGRGLFQITGRDNYRRYSPAAGIDLVTDPDAAARPDIATRIAVAYWSNKRMALPADRDDVEAVTRLINGGLNGIDARRRFLDRAKGLLA